MRQDLWDAIRTMAFEEQFFRVDYDSRVEIGNDHVHPTQDGYDMVVDKQAVPYVRSDLDLTDRVIQSYNQGGGGDSKSEGKGGAKAPAAPKAPAGAAPAPALTPPAVAPKP